MVATGASDEGGAGHARCYSFPLCDHRGRIASCGVEGLERTQERLTERNRHRAISGRIKRSDGSTDGMRPGPGQGVVGEEQHNLCSTSTTPGLARFETTPTTAERRKCILREIPT